MTINPLSSLSCTATTSVGVVPDGVALRVAALVGWSPASVGTGGVVAAMATDVGLTATVGEPWSPLESEVSELQSERSASSWPPLSRAP